MSIQSSRSPAKHKFRDSCNGCAVAKVKCSKARPICSRCEDRGLTCHYSPSHRLGRRPASASTLENISMSMSKSTTVSSASNSNTATPRASPPALTDFSTTSEPILATPTSNRTTHQASSSVSNDFPTTSTSTSNTITHQDPLPALNDFSATSSPFINPDTTFSEEPWLLSPFPSLGEDLNMDFFSPTMNLSGNNTSGGQAYEQWPRIGLEDDFMANNSAMITPNNSAIVTPTSSYGSYGNNSSHIHPPDFIGGSNSTPDLFSSSFGLFDVDMCAPSGKFESGSGCMLDASCLFLATNLLMRQHSLSSAPSTDEVISTNKATVDTAMLILKCSCHTKNNHIAVLVTLVTFKVLSWYMVVAQDDSSNNGITNYPSPPNSNFTHGLSPSNVLSSQSDGGPMRAQIVLGELHRVVTLVHMLSEAFNKEIQEQMYRCASVNGEVSMSGTGENNEAGRLKAISGFLRPLLDSLKERLQIVTKMTMAINRANSL